MKRIFIPQLSESANKKFEEKKFENIKIKIKLDKSNLHYIKNVLRHKNGEEILAFDGQQECLCLLNGENIEIVKFIRKNESQKTLKLAIAQIKAPRLEWLIEKATEIGVTEIFLLETKFTQNKIHNMPRLEKIAIQACAQSNRITVPKIYHAIKIDEFIKKNSSINNKWSFGALNCEKPNNMNEIANIDGIIIGPEGGFCENEAKKLYEFFNPINLSNNILRSETAALVGLYIIQSLLLEKSYIE